jgi:hypothetical protein
MNFIFLNNSIPCNPVTFNIVNFYYLGEQYNYEWKLISQPADSTGAMQNAASSTLTLSHLSEGVYQFRVTVTGTHSAGDGYANVSVLPGNVKLLPKILCLLTFGINY